jgi:hypothetical protein
MTGQIPKYGKNFRHGRVGIWSPEFTDTIYMLKADPEWFIRSDKTSKRWSIFHGYDRDTAVKFGKVWPSMTVAMARLLEGVELGFYVTKDKGAVAWEAVKEILSEDEYWQYDDAKRIIVEPTKNPDRFTFTVTGFGVDRGCVEFRDGKPDVWFHDEDTMRKCQVCGWKAAS